MSYEDLCNIRIRHGSKLFHVHGENAGLEGVWLAKGQVDGIYDAPVTTTWKTGAFQVGSTQKARKWTHRDMTLGFHVIDTALRDYGWNDSEFRKIFDYELDPWDPARPVTTIELDHIKLGSTRKLDVLMFDAPKFGPDLDPNLNQHGNIILQLRAGQPMWYEDDAVTVFEHSATFRSGTILVENPTDQIMRHSWVLTRGTWVVPDFQWVGPKNERVPGGDQGERVVEMQPITEDQGGAVISLDRTELMIRDAHDTNILAVQNGKFFVYPIPPYTASQPLPIAYEDAPVGGARAELHQPRRWSRPWGLEYPTSGS